MTAGRHTTRVLVVGFGPVGKLVAIALGRRGHAVTVVDKNHAAYPLPRAVTHCSDVARILQSIGLAPDTITGITVPYDDMYRWQNSDGRTLLEVDWSGRGESGWYNTYFFHQPDLEDALDRIVDGLDCVTVVRGAEALTVEQATDGAGVHLRDVATGEESTVDAEWIVAADGANSTIRSAVGIDLHDDGYFHDWLVVDVEPHEGVQFPHIATQNCDVRRPSTMVPGGPGRRRWEFMRLPHESVEDLNRPDKAWELLEPYGLSPSNSVLERHSVYTFQSCWAEQWRAGRVLVAGDAAHLMPPFAGQGLGAGLRDAMNLGWKLDAVLAGHADETLLDTYGTERKHHAVEFVRFSTSLGQVICITDPDEAAERDRRMVAELQDGAPPPAPPRPGLGPGLHVGPTGGTLAHQGVVQASGDTALLDDLVGGPGALITRRAATLDEVPARCRAALGDVGIALVALSGASDVGTVVEDVDGTYDRWLREMGAETVLVRPDFHVYGSATAAGTAELVEGFLERLGRTVAVST